MSIEVICLQCGASHHVNNRLAGRRIRCPKCDTAVHVPEANGAAQTDPVDDSPLPAEIDSAAELGPAAGTIGEPFVAPTFGSIPARVLDTEPHDTQPDVPGDDDEDDEPVLQRNKRPEEEMDMTPMVDVTFLLLIFFMVTAAFSLQKSIEMPRQQTDAPSTSVIEEETEDLDMVELQVDEFGSFLVMAPDWERETPGKQNLVTALKEAITGRGDAMRLVIKVHELAKLKALVDAMDAGTIAGYSQLEVTQVEEFD